MRSALDKNSVPCRWNL